MPWTTKRQCVESFGQPEPSYSEGVFSGRVRFRFNQSCSSLPSQMTRCLVNWYVLWSRMVKVRTAASFCGEHCQNHICMHKLLWILLEGGPVP